MDRFNLSTANIYELCEEIVKILNKDGITNDVTLTIPLDKDKFKKVDEDLFYRMRENDNDEFIPSEGKINVRVENVVLIITENGV